MTKLLTSLCCLTDIKLKSLPKSVLFLVNQKVTLRCRPMMVGAFVGIFSLPVSAVQTQSSPELSSYQRTNENLRYSVLFNQKPPSWMDETNDYLSKLVLDFSEYIDHGLAKDDNEEAIVNRSYIKIKTFQTYSYRGLYDSDESIAVRVDLPHTEHNWKLILETDPDDYDNLESKQRGTSTGSPTKDGAFGGVRLQGEQISQWKTNFDIGVKLRFPIDPFTRAELYRVGKLSDNWTTLFSQEFFYFKSKGLGSLTNLNFYYDVDELNGQIFKLGSSAQYLYDDDQWELVHQATYFDRRNEKNLVEYSLGMSLLPYEDKEVSNYWLSASWIHKLYKNWLYLTITPELEFPREYDYKFNPGVFIELEAFFSKNRKLNRLNRYIPSPTTE